MSWLRRDELVDDLSARPVSSILAATSLSGSRSAACTGSEVGEDERLDDGLDDELSDPQPALEYVVVQ